jgi:hypothetical protein
MKRIVLISIIILTTSLTAIGQDTIYSIAYYWPQPVSYFEDRDTENYFYFDTTQTNNIWQIGTPSKAIFDSAYSKPLALLTDTINNYPDNTQSSFEFVIRTDDHTSISFWHRFDTDLHKDGGIIEVSTDGGLSWINVVKDTINDFSFINFYSSSDTIISNNNEEGFTGSSGGWIKSTIYKSGGMEYYRFRFTFSSDSVNNGSDGWMIDNFEFLCIGTGIEETWLSDQINIYPNPTTDKFSIIVSDKLKLYYIKIYDNIGHVNYKGTKSNIDFTGWTRGLYFVEVVTDQGSVIKKILKN